MGRDRAEGGGGGAAALGEAREADDLLVLVVDEDRRPHVRPLAGRRRRPVDHGGGRVPRVTRVVHLRRPERKGRRNAQMRTFVRSNPSSCFYYAMVADQNKVGMALSLESENNIKSVLYYTY